MKAVVSQQRAIASMLFLTTSIILSTLLVEQGTLSSLMQNIELRYLDVRVDGDGDNRTRTILLPDSIGEIHTTESLQHARPSESNTISERIDNLFSAIPHNNSETQWLREYIIWHHEMRRKYPEEAIIDHGPNVTIAYLDPAQQKGGLTDRMKGLGHMVYFAYQAKRVLLLKWYDAPLPLESFLVPNLLNFTMPNHPSAATTELLCSTFNQPDGKVLLYKFINQMGNYLNPYGVIWHSVFKPSPAVQSSIRETMETLGLVAGKFDAIHFRLGHPASRNKKAYNRTLDEEKGRNFEGTYRWHALSEAIGALKCSNWLPSQHGFSNETSLPTYLYADSEDFIKSVLIPSSIEPENEEEHAIIATLTQLGHENNIVGRTDAPVVHLENRNNETAVDAYISTFVDLYLASQARCLSIGVGRFAYMAGKISGTKCWARHQAPSKSVGAHWGMTLMSREVPICPYAKTY